MLMICGILVSIVSSKTQSRVTNHTRTNWPFCQVFRLFQSKDSNVTLLLSEEFLSFEKLAEAQTPTPTLGTRYCFLRGYGPRRRESEEKVSRLLSVLSKSNSEWIIRIEAPQSDSSGTPSVQDITQR